MAAGGSGGKMIPLLIPLSISFAIGITVAFLTTAAANHLAMGVLIFLGLSIFFTKARTILLCATFLCLGAWRFSAVEENTNNQPLLTFVGDTPKLARIRGKVVSAPVNRISSIESNTILRTTCQIEISELFQDTNWVAMDGRIAVTINGACESYRGNMAEVSGLLMKPQGPLAPGLFDYKEWLKTQGILYEMRVNSSNEWKTLSTDFFGSLSGRFTKWAMETLALGLPARDKELGLQWAMVLGWRSAFQGEIKEPYLRSGTLHIFAISGMHIAVMSGILLVVLKTIRIPRHFAGLIVIPTIWFYTAATGWQPSAIRASVMMTIVISGWILSRPPRLLNSLAGSALLLLLHDPRELFQPGFQLSFMVVAALGIIPPLFEKLIEELNKPDPWIPKRLVAWHIEVGLWFRREFFRALVVSFAATAGSLALTMYYFNLVTPIGLIANIIVAPLSGVALCSALGSLITKAIGLSWFTEIFNHSTWLWMMLMDRLSILFSEIPYGSWHVRKPSVIFVLSFYAALSFVVAGFRSKRNYFWVAGLLFIITTLDLFRPLLSDREKAILTILPLGGGSVFVNQPGSKNDLLVDTGDKHSVQLLMDVLHAEGLDRIANVVLTHGDVLHIGGASELAKHFHPKATYISPVNFRSRPYREELSALTNLTIPLYKAVSKTEIAGWKVLSPGTNTQHRIADDLPVVLYAEISGCKVLLLSDLSPTGQRRLINEYSDLKADLVIAGLPSQGEPVIEEFLEGIGPRAIIISDDDFPWTSRANNDLRERLKSREVYYCSDEGAITIEIKSHARHLSTMRGRKTSF